MNTQRVKKIQNISSSDQAQTTEKNLSNMSSKIMASIQIEQQLDGNIAFVPTVLQTTIFQFNHTCCVFYNKI